MAPRKQPLSDTAAESNSLSTKITSRFRSTIRRGNGQRGQEEAGEKLVNFLF
jgi:hypothetical protein